MRGRLGSIPPAVSVGVLCFLVALGLNGLLLHESGLGGDGPYYERMASHPGGPHTFPYAFRVGLPYVVHLLPFSHGFSWEALALVAIAAAAGGLFELLSEFGIDRRVAAWLAVCFSVSPPLLVVLLRDGRSVDAAAILVITLGCLFIVRRQRAALAVTLLVGATVHESCMFLVPLAYAVWAQRLFDPRALRDLVIVAALPVGVYLYLRSSIVALDENYQPGYSGAFLTERVDVVRLAVSNGGWTLELRRIAIAFGPLWLAAPFALTRLRFARRGLVLVALCVGSMTYALDWDRVIFFAAPVIYVSAAYVLRGRRMLTLIVIATFLLLDLGYAGYMQVHGVKYGLDTTGPPARGPAY